MSVEVITAVLHHSRAKGTAKLVLLGIANHAGDGGAWPTIETLSRYANVHERNVQHAIDQLVKAGELQVHRQDGGSQHLKQWQRPNRYDVLVACPITCDRSTNHRIRDLPTAPAHLWIEGVATAPPGGDSATPGVATAPPKPSIEPTTQLTVPSSVTARRARPCSECGLPEAECQRRSATSGHAFTPKATGPTLVDVAARAELHRALG